MAEERVDKQWQHQGLGPYSTQAILGTLRHYGVALDEGAFREAAKDSYPLELAQQWQPMWKGKGQFARFHWAAAEELTRRLFADRLMPGELSRALVELMQALGRMNEGAPDAPVGPAFKKVAELRPKVPQEGGKPDPRFVTEVRMRLGEWMKVFGGISQELAKNGHVEDAEEFAGIEEFLFPQWAGVSRALVRAAKGEKAEALADLSRIAQEPSRDGPSKANAVDALLHLDALAQAREAGLSILTEAEQKDDLHLALEVGERLMFAMEKLGDTAGLAGLVPRLQKLHDRHAHEHHH